MRNLTLFIWKHSFFFLFLLLEIVCVYLVVRNNSFQKASFINSANSLSISVLGASNNIKDYFHLKNENENLAKENAILRTHSLISFSKLVNSQYTIYDTVYNQKYTYTNCKVVNNSTNRRNNYITLNKGEKHGVQRNMGVITSEGIVGLVKEVSTNFCTVMSLLHSKASISSKIKKNNFFGPLTWDGKSFRYATLVDIPSHVDLAIGDTIVTSAYSLSFPENIMVGTIDSYEKKEGAFFYIIKVKLSTEFKKLSHVYVVNNLQKKEQLELEELSKKGD